MLNIGTLCSSYIGLVKWKLGSTKGIPCFTGPHLFYLKFPCFPSSPITTEVFTYYITVLLLKDYDEQMILSVLCSYANVSSHFCSSPHLVKC